MNYFDPLQREREREREKERERETDRERGDSSIAYKFHKLDIFALTIIIASFAFKAAKQTLCYRIGKIKFTMFPSESQRKRCRNRKTWCGACVNFDASVPNSINIQDWPIYINIAVVVIGMGGKSDLLALEIRPWLWKCLKYVSNPNLLRKTWYFKVSF